MGRITIRISGELEEIGYINYGRNKFYKLSLDNLEILDSNGNLCSLQDSFLYHLFPNKCLFLTNSNLIRVGNNPNFSFYKSLIDSNCCNFWQSGSCYKSSVGNTCCKPYCALFLEIYLNNNGGKNKAYIISEENKKLQNLPIDTGDNLTFEFEINIKNEDKAENEDKNEYKVILKRIIKK